MKKNKLGVMALALALTFCLVSGSIALANSSTRILKNGKWLAGDLHNHTYLTDGSFTQKDVVEKAFDAYGLDWMANSEHGGTSWRDAQGNPLDEGDFQDSEGNWRIWRWKTLKDISFPIIEELRGEYQDKLLVQGVEWNVPTHEHASVGIITNEPTAISDFEYMFDEGDQDTSRESEGLVKQNSTHDDAVTAAKWLQNNYPETSYYIINHPSRKLKYSIADIRDFNNAAPDVCFGIEGLPGHQKSEDRGGYGRDMGEETYKARTYGGADYMVAKVGGLWDALLGEGRHFWTFVNSDFHSTDGDFWPGEYAKSYTWVKGVNYKSLVDGMRAGNSFAVQGDLIDALEFSARSKNNVAVMGQELLVNEGDNAQITIRFKSPATNNNGDAVKVDHIDLIAGDVTGKAQPGTPEYEKETNDTTRVIATFTEKDWEKDGGCYVIKYNLKKVEKDQYFRLRGTNLGFNVANETDAEGNPLVDSLLGTNNAEKAYADLWFYSNPVFVTVH